MVQKSRLGVNVGSITYYDTRPIALNVAKHSNGWSNYQNFISGYRPEFDPSGNLSSLPSAAGWQYFDINSKTPIRELSVDLSGNVNYLLGSVSATDPVSGLYELYGAQRASMAFSIAKRFTITSGSTLKYNDGDPNNYPLGVSGINYSYFSGGPSSFVLSYEGDGTISSITNAFHPYFDTTSGTRVTLFIGGTIVSGSGREIEFRPPSDAGVTVWINLDKIDKQASSTAVPRNIKVVETQYRDIDADAHPIHPKFLDVIKNGPNGISPKFSCLRLMDLFETNGTPSAAPFYDDIENHPHFNHQSYGAGHNVHGYSVPWKFAISLLNETECDGWICIPAASGAERDEHISAVATYIRDNLNSSSTIYTEYSNETWNSQFSSYAYTVAKGAEMFPSDGDPNVRRYKYHAYMSNKIARIFKEVFAVQGRQDKIKGVVGCQSAGPYWVSSIMVPYMQASGLSSIDAFAGAPYFVGEFINQTNASALMFHTSSASQIAKMAYDYVVSGISLSGPVGGPSAGVTIISSPNQNAPYASTDRIGGLARYCKSQGYDYLAYEGGPHMVPYFPHTIREYSVYSLNLLMASANQDPWMGSAVYEYLKDWNTYTSGSLFCYFSLIGAWGQYGSWGDSENIWTYPEGYPKAEAIEAFIRDYPLITEDVSYYISLLSTHLRLLG